MSFDWKSWIARIDDMNLRERAMLFGSVALVVVVTAHVTLIDRALVNQKRLTERVTRDQSQLKSVREQLQLILKENQPELACRLQVHGDVDLGRRDNTGLRRVQTATLDLPGQLARLTTHVSRIGRQRG